MGLWGLRDWPSSAGTVAVGTTATQFLDADPMRKAITIWAGPGSRISIGPGRNNAIDAPDSISLTVANEAIDLVGSWVSSELWAIATVAGTLLSFATYLDPSDRNSSSYDDPG